MCHGVSVSNMKNRHAKLSHNQWNVIPKLVSFVFETVFPKFQEIMNLGRCISLENGFHFPYETLKICRDHLNSSSFTLNA